MDEMKIDHDLYTRNSQTVVDIRDKMEAEIEAVAATNNPAALGVAKDVQAILEILMGTAAIRSRGVDTDVADVTQLIGSYLGYLRTVLSGGILTPLTGREEEWEDIDAPADGERRIICLFNGKEYPIEFKSVQVNRRYQNIYRFNKDNNYAHRADMIRFVDRNNPKRYVTTQLSRRFIKFPYTLDQVDCLVDVDENGTILGYPDDLDELKLQSQIAFFTSNGGVIAAPSIPFHFLKKEGIDYKQAVQELTLSRMKVIK